MAAILAAWGGTINFLHRVKRGKVKCNLREYAIEIFTSLFAGLTVCAIVLAFNWSPYLAGAFAGLGGHYGARTIFLLRGVLIGKIKGLDDSK